MPILHPVGEVAEQLNVGLTTAKALIKSGQLRSVKIGRSRRVPADALYEFVRRLDAEQNGAPPDLAPLNLAPAAVPSRT